MKIQARTNDFLVADGKFFTGIDCSEEGVVTYRQIECYMFKEDCEDGAAKQPLMMKRLQDFENGKEFRWAIGSTGNQLTARYQIRESDGELMSMLALNGGIAKG